MNIVFAGTPAFTLPCLDALAESTHELKAVYTQPDRPAGRGRHLQASAVKMWAENHQIPVRQPPNFKQEEAITALAAFKPDVLVVIAYGLILPQAVLDLPRFGCINVHASLLPRWRGASPIQQSILKGDTDTGITIMQMDVGLDTGAMLSQVHCAIGCDNATALHDRLARLAVAPLLATLDAFASGTVQRKSQDNTQATYAPKITKEDAAIDWQKSAIEIDRQIRAFNPWPIAYTTVNDTTLRVYKAQVVSHAHAKKPGTLLSIDKAGLLVATGDDAILIEQIQFPGGKSMSVADWLHAGRNQLTINMILQ